MSQAQANISIRLGFHFKTGPYPRIDQALPYVHAAIEIGPTAHPGWARKYKMIYPEPTSSF